MWEDKYETIERSKPTDQPASESRAKRLGGLVDPRRLFRRNVYLYMGFAGFFLLGTVIGTYLGSSGEAGKPEAERPDVPAERSTKAAPAVRPDLKVKAYAYTTPAPRIAPANDVPTESEAVERPKTQPVPPAIRPPERPSATPGETGISRPAGQEEPPEQKPAWLAYAVPQKKPEASHEPMIAVVIDDLGIDQKRTRNTISLPAPLTMAFLPYGYNLGKLTEAARQAGHELIVHMPMEPNDIGTDPGPNALLRNLGPQEIRERIRWNLSRFGRYVGVSNHMGSGFTRWEEGMAIVLEEMKDRGLLYLDSLTSGASVAGRVSSAIDLPFAVRDVFLDNDQAPEKIRRQLDELERIARQRGYAIGIGHPYDSTVSVLSSWLKSAEERGVRFVPLSEIVKRRYSPREKGPAIPPVSSPAETPDRSTAG